MVRPSKVTLAILALCILLPFQNCSETLPEKNANSTTDNSSITPPSGTYALTSMPNKSTVLPGSALSFTTAVASASNAPPSLLKLTVRHPNQTVIWTENKPVPAVSSGQSLNVVHDFPIPESMPAANYTVSAQLLSADQSQVLQTVNSATTFTVQAPIRVNVGSPISFTDSQGKVWAPDSGFSGNSVMANETHPATVNSPDQFLWENFRWGPGDFTYTASVPTPGKYKVTLRWTEHYVFGPNLRRFNVAINGQQVLQEFDLFVEAGGAYMAYDRTFVITTATPSIAIDFTHGTIENPKISAIEILGAP